MQLTSSSIPSTTCRLRDVCAPTVSMTWQCASPKTKIQECQFNNGSSFTSRSLKEHPLEQGQTSQFSGARSHHQNGRAERGMQTTMGSATKMPLHSASHWPDVSDSSLWPMGVQQAVWIHNCIPSGKTGLSCHDLWSRTKCPLHELHNVHAFGCPVCVLQKRLSDGMLTPRQEERSD